MLKVTLKNLENYFLLIVCLIPIWFYQEINSLSKLIFVYFFILISFFLLILYLIEKIKKTYLKKKLLSIYFSLVCFYGLESKLGFWVYFDRFIEIGILRYLFSFIFCIGIIYFFFKLFLKSFVLKKILISVISFQIVFYLSYDYYSHSRYQIFEKIHLSHQTISSNTKKKILILFPDTMVGYDGIDESLEYGKLAKQSYFDLAKKYDLHLFTSVYSIYASTDLAIPSLLNFDFQTTKDNTSNYYEKNLVDKKTIFTMKKNAFFNINKDKKIISIKNMFMNFCDNNVASCVSSNPVNNYGVYLNEFLFSENDYFLKKMHQQGSIIFQYFWRIIHYFKLNNHYHDIVFNKVKFKSDLNNLNRLISSTDYDIYFFQFISPHNEFGFDVDIENKKCTFNKEYLTIKPNNTSEKEIMNNHYKDIICTNIYFDKFFYEIRQNRYLNDIDIFIITDTGFHLGLDPKDHNQYSLKNQHSVVFTIYGKDKKFNLDNQFISSQELFSKYFNPLYQKSLDERKVHIKDNVFKSIDKF